MSRFSLAGKTAVVTGGSRGIGRAIALGLAEAGADVVFTYRAQIAEAEDVGNQIIGMGRRALALHMDVTSRASVEKAAEDSRKLGPVSILVNNAGINKPTDFDQVTDADWDNILATNLKGPFVCAQVFLPLLAAAKLPVPKSKAPSAVIRAPAGITIRAPIRSMVAPATTLNTAYP